MLKILIDIWFKCIKIYSGDNMIFYKNAKVIFPDKIRDCVVAVDNGKIADICESFETK